MFARTFFTVGLAASVASAVGIVRTGIRDPGRSIAPPTTTISDVDFDRLLSGFCMRCFTCPGRPRSHSLEFKPLRKRGYTGDHPEDCEWGSCTAARHRPCGGPGEVVFAEAEELPAVLGAMKTATAEELMAVLVRHPLRVRLNHTRQALQLVGCEDQVVASYGTSSIPALQVLLNS